MVPPVHSHIGGARRGAKDFAQFVEKSALSGLRELPHQGCQTADLTDPAAEPFASISPDQGQTMGGTYDTDLTRLRAGADGLATFIDTNASRSVTPTAAHPDACSGAQA